MNAVIGVLALLVVYLAYTYVSRSIVSPEVEHVSSDHGAAQRVIQLDILNGCGVRGAASRFTEFLRRAGFDVVEMKNYTSYSVAHTLVIDRAGNMDAARRVAAALGVEAKYVIQQLNRNDYVDVSVVLGHDHTALRPFHSSGEQH